ncbi:dynein regulatory complex protein 9 [Nematolebias whitei]|uniref:dynein regulatory complex protein 9 n=1 Tax=Nematolebias whitei TaxID=451745 RepID=UPI00189A9375|nr:dynein regulatory complex protein 9 [Nematolebias whitei]
MSLGLMQSLRTAAVLEDCVHQLDLLGHCLTVQISRDQRATPVQEEDRLIRMKMDCQFISQQMSKLSSELEGKQSFSCLLQTVEKKEKKRNEKTIKTQIRLELIKQMELRQRIQTKLDTLKEINFVWKELKAKAVTKKAEMKNAEEELKKKILEEEARQNENQQTKTWKAQIQQAETRQLENKLQEQLELLQKQLEEEESAHLESLRFLHNQHKEMQQQLNIWKQQTKQMLQDKQKHVNSILCKRSVNIDILMEMRRKFREMEQVVIEDKLEQEQLFQQEAEARAATKLQAWWRGCMVRRGLRASKDADNKKYKKKKVKK